MIKTKTQGIIFGVIMSYAMAYGMEVYNMAIKMGFSLQPGGFSSMTNIVFWEALKEAAYMGLFVLLLELRIMLPICFVMSFFFLDPLAQRIAFAQVAPGVDKPILVTLVRAGVTVALMCPTMSLVASILFSVILGGASWVQLPAIWVGTVLKNFPMAFLWNFFAAAPFSHWLFGKIFQNS